MQQEKSKLFSFSTLSLVIANLIPIGGVLYFDWNVAFLLYLYWAESLVIGFFTVKKMIRSVGSGLDTSKFRDQPYTPEQMNHAHKFFTIPFFILHYGGFAFGHFIFLKIFLNYTNTSYTTREFLLLLGILFLSHYVSYRINYVGKEEYRVLDVHTLASLPYKRVVIMHLVIIASAFLMQKYNANTGMLIALVGIKTVIDVYAHMFEHAFRGRNKKTIIW